MTSVLNRSELAVTPEAPLSDQDARDRIERDLDTCFLVEAGAGSGKTTSLVGRLLAYVLRGTPVQQLAAVTFTRKAAGELRERFQLRLEHELIAARAIADDLERIQRLDRAITDLDRAFLGTIHSFCGRLLRERPIEAGLDPGFTELTEEDAESLVQRFWERWLERCRQSADADLLALRSLGVDARALRTPFEEAVSFSDVDFETHAVERACPDHAPCRSALEALLATAGSLLPDAEPPAGWDGLQKTVRRLTFLARANDWSRPADFAAAVEEITDSSCKITQNRWAEDKEGKARVKALAGAVTEWHATMRADWLREWYEHRYPVVLRFLTRAAAEFARERLATGRLNFEDLLSQAATLLRTSPEARRDLGVRYRYLLVDEFQDTDPVQAEVCFLLASDPDEGDQWTTVTPRSGALFVVGDPKQSIFRFRRADIETYETVKGRLATFGAVLALTTNFRSVPAVARFVNDHFASDEGFGAGSTAYQAAFSPMIPFAPEGASPGVYRYVIECGATTGSDTLVAIDAARVASWIAQRVNSGERQASDFLVLTYQTKHLGVYARALAEHNIPATTTGAQLPQERELHELVAILTLLADPESSVLTVTALEGSLFGCSPAELFDARQAGARFAITHPPYATETRVGAALQTLYEWWLVSQRQPPDAVVERILDETGLLPYAASLDLGDARAGALLHLVDRLRTSDGGGGLTAAIETIERTLEAKAADAPLRPGSADAVRIMNLHKSKGLEAPVVILAAPVPRPEFEPRRHVTRGADGRATGGLCLTTRVGQVTRTIAQPVGWSAMAEIESRFLYAEWVRLLYVATTRAKTELVIGQLDARKVDGSPAAKQGVWAALDRVLAEHAEPLAFVELTPPGRRRLEETSNQIIARASAADARRLAAAQPSQAVRTVSQAAKEHAEDAERTLHRRYRRVEGEARGPAWGRAVHRTLEAAGRGREGVRLGAFVNAVVRDEGLVGPDDDVSAESTRLLALVERIRASTDWTALRDAAVRRFELTVATCERVEDAGRDGGELLRVTEGVLDAAHLDGERWTVLDWKSDAVDDATWAERRVKHEQQVALYAAMLETAGIGSATGKIIRAR